MAPATPGPVFVPVSSTPSPDGPTRFIPATRYTACSATGGRAARNGSFFFVMVGMGFGTNGPVKTGRLNQDRDLLVRPLYAPRTLQGLAKAPYTLPPSGESVLSASEGKDGLETAVGTKTALRDLVEAPKDDEPGRY